ncbi:uncharacterized protein [Rutidosis leptorrhynchoides]|uniref:uncharacterized protein n=1 Tax=Rutidosis leptorrhynchoides TaxID=125765 RepID=UPI003A9962E0
MVISKNIIRVLKIDGRKVNFTIKIKVVRLLQKLGYGYDEGKPNLELIISDEEGAKIVINIRNSLKAKFDNLIREWGFFCISNAAVVDNVIGRVANYSEIQDFRNTGELKSKYINPQFIGQFFLDFENHMKVLDDDASVILLIHFGVTKLHQDKLAISTDWKNTNVLIDADHPQIIEFRKRLTQIHSSEDSICSLAPSLSISSARDPNSFFNHLLNIVGLDRLNPSMEGIYIIQATINTILPDDTWYYISYKKCNKSSKPVIPNCDLTLDVDQHLNLEGKCYGCINKPDVVVRFKVPIRVENQTGTSSFTVFESVVKKFVTQSAYELMKALSEDDDYHEELELLLQKTLLFKIDVDQQVVFEDVEIEESSEKLTSVGNCASNASGSQTVDLSHDTYFSPPLKKINKKESNLHHLLSLQKPRLNSLIVPNVYAHPIHDLNNIHLLTVIFGFLLWNSNGM